MDASTTSATSTSSPRFLCNLCSMQYDTSVMQRAHMKEPWHVYNLKRRMATLPAVSFETFSNQVNATGNVKTHSPQAKDIDESTSETDSEVDEVPLSTLCIFCSTVSPSLESNVEHMSSSHALTIPDMQHLIDLESFIIYLNTLVQTFHECICCGHARHSVESIRQHMIHKQHCKLDLSEESDLLDFWGFPEADEDEPDKVPEEELRRAKIQRLSNAETILPSGAVVYSRTSRIGGKHVKKNRKPLPALPSSIELNAPTSKAAEAHPPNSTPTTELTRRSQALASRNEMGLTGVTSQQRLQLRAVEKRMMKQEALARAHQRWGVERIANRQKHFKPDVPGRLNG